MSTATKSRPAPPPPRTKNNDTEKPNGSPQSQVSFGKITPGVGHRIAVFGPGGVGKTSLAATAPGPVVFFDLDESLPVWTALIAKRNIYDIARCLKLSADCSPQSWRLAVLGLAKSDQFFEAKPSEILLRRQDWERWRSLKESPRKMLDLLRKIIYGVKIWD